LVLLWLWLALLFLTPFCWADQKDPQVLRPHSETWDLLQEEPDTPETKHRDFEMPRPYRLALGVSYFGEQLRYEWSSRWATELRHQHGKASSDQGDVSADVFGLRGYRSFHRRERFSFYWGGEGAYAKANPSMSTYRVTGVALGAFGGMEYRVMKRITVNADLGPYVISLKEKQTNVSSTNLDFVLNTALNMYLF
jgi:opacity protein-like surface antigen